MTLELIDFIEETDGVDVTDFPPEVTNRINSALSGLTDTADGPSNDQSTATAIWDWTDLDEIRDDLSGEYKLVRDLDEDSPGYNDVVDGGFDPLGDSDNPFTGMFYGNGKAIEDLELATGNRIGLFSFVTGTVENLTLTNATVDNPGGSITGVLAGQLVGTARNVTVEHNGVTGGSNTGGLVGALGSQSGGNGNIQGSLVSVFGESNATIESKGTQAGGITGLSFGGSIQNSETSVTIKGQRRVGGLIGAVAGDTIITTSAAIGEIEGANWRGRLDGQSIGGLVGDAPTFAGGLDGNLTIEESYTTATIKGTENVGGLLGNDVNGGDFVKIKRSYSIADIKSTGDADLDGNTADDYQKRIGGLVGKGAPDIDNSYAAPTITTNANGTGDGADIVGGVIGTVIGPSETTGTNTYWDTESTGSADPTGDDYSLNATGLNTSQMQDSRASSNMSGLDFDAEWTTNTDDYPTLQ